MTKLMSYLSLGCSVALIAATGAGAQQAAMPTPPKTVHPLPQSTTDCRGCSDQSDAKPTTDVKYDERKAGTVKPAVRPDAKAASSKAKRHRKPAAHARKKTHPASAPKKTAVKQKADSVRK